MDSTIKSYEQVKAIAFMVTASCRKRGVGSRLMDAAKEWSKARNLDYIELLALYNAKEANAFYQQYGFNIKSLY